MRSTIIITTGVIVIVGLAIFVLLALVGGFRMPWSTQPLFSSWALDSETARSGWGVNMGGTTDNLVDMRYDDPYNILVVGEKTPGIHELILYSNERRSDYIRVSYFISGGQMIADIRLPLWKNSAILFDKTGLLRVVFLEKTKARELCNAIQKDPSTIDRIFAKPKGPE